MSQSVALDRNLDFVIFYFQSHLLSLAVSVLFVAHQIVDLQRTQVFSIFAFL